MAAQTRSQKKPLKSPLKTPVKKSRTSRKTYCPPCKRTAVLPAVAPRSAASKRRRNSGSGPYSSKGCTIRKRRIGKKPNKNGMFKCREVPDRRAARLACYKDPKQCDKTYRNRLKARRADKEKLGSGDNGGNILANLFGTSS